MSIINSIDDIEYGLVCKVPLEDEIKYFEERLIPMIEEYGEKEMNLSLEEVKQALKEFKIEMVLKDLYIGEKKNY